MAADRVQRFAETVWFGIQRGASESPRALAEAAHYVGGPSVDELESKILSLRVTAEPLRRSA